MNKKFHYISFIFLFCLIGCSAGQEDSQSFSVKWKNSIPEERKEIADPKKLYELLRGKTKEEVELYLGIPDRIDSFGDFVYLIGKNKAGDFIYDLTCVVAFDGSSTVKRIEVSQP
ncbi:MAG: outer membrane protein assembly factor BamE [Desulfobacteraceae bacterium]|nr:outer membrane protein assembly factor BamE [Desulfobacteraceae bacterium]